VATALEFLTAAGFHPRSAAVPLSGGVSSDIWRVELTEGPVCVKRALPRLRVAQLWEAPIERNRYERQWLQTAARAVPGAAPKVLAWDDAAGLFAMECLDYPVWKAELAAGRADAGFAAQVGGALGAIHAATAGDKALAQTFATDAIFHAIRLEPYLLATARKHPAQAKALETLARRTADTRQCLVHGDVSPKNILVSPGGPIFLDAECAWYGDPAFDLAFCLNHLLLKGAWLPRWRADFLACFDALSTAYLAKDRLDGVERRAATLLPALLLARVDGKSPVEYLDADARERVRRAALGLLQSAPATLGKVKDEWQGSST
jgi:aminoglycoside phosphotransferase (APT) family kinase protein